MQKPSASLTILPHLGGPSLNLEVERPLAPHLSWIATPNFFKGYIEFKILPSGLSECNFAGLN